MKKLILTIRSDDYMVHLEGSPSVWDVGKTIREAIGAWVLTHGSDHGIDFEIPEVRKRIDFQP